MENSAFGKKEIGILSFAFLLIVAIFYFAPFEAGRDWRVINGGLQRFISGDVVYKVTMVDDLPYGYYQVPWLVLILSPLAFIPVKLSYSIISAASIFAVLALAKRYKMGIPQLILFLISPPVLYNIWQGHIDILTLLVLFAPREVWPLFSIAKPQLTGGLGFALLIEPKRWLRTALVCGTVILISFALFGFWPMQIFEMASGEFGGYVLHNVLKDLWPLQLIIGIGILVIGLDRKGAESEKVKTEDKAETPAYQFLGRDERYFIAAAPFLSRYATFGNFVGVTMVAISAMKWWQALAFVITWWVALVYN